MKRVHKAVDLLELLLVRIWLITWHPKSMNNPVSYLMFLDYAKIWLISSGVYEDCQSGKLWSIFVDGRNFAKASLR